MSAFVQINNTHSSLFQKTTHGFHWFELHTFYVIQTNEFHFKQIDQKKQFIHAQTSEK